VRVCHSISAVFDDPNLIGTAGLVPVMALAERAGLADLVAERIAVAGSAGANAELMIGSLVAGMIAGADSIEDMDVVRHGGGPWPAHEHSDLDGKASWSQLDPDDYYEPVRVTVSLFGNGLIRVNVAGSPQVQIIVHEGISTRTVASAIGQLIEALQVA